MGDNDTPHGADDSAYHWPHVNVAHYMKATDAIVAEHAAAQLGIPYPKAEDAEPR